MMKLKLRLSAFTTVFMLLTTSATHAAQVNFTPTLTLSEEYTDNLFLTGDDDNKVDDYITTAELDLNFEVLSRTAGLSLDVAPSYNKFTNNEDFDYWRYFGHLNLWTALTRNSRLELSSTYLETEDPRDQTDDGTETDIDIDTTRRNRNRYLRNSNEIRLIHQYGARSSFFGAVAYNLHRDIDIADGVALDDYDEVRPSIGIEHWFTSRWGLELESYRSDRSYEDRDDRTEYDGSLRLRTMFNRRLSGYVQYRYTALDFDQETMEQDYTISAPSIGMEYQLAESSTLGIGAGYYVQNFDDGDDNSGAFIDAELNHRWNYRTGFIALIASSGYDIEDTGAEELGLQIYYEGRIEAGYSFTNRFSGDIYVSYRNDDYPNQVPERSDQTFNAGAGLSYQVLRWMHIRLSYNYENVTSDIDTEEFTENSALFTITMAPSSPFRLN